MSYNQAELRRRVGELLKRPENKECADCTERLPKWAVVNHGIFVCLNCSGQHRNIGAHISKVKSATLDDWTPEEVAFMASMGNAKANATLLANLPPGMSKPASSDDRGRERWIKQKYAQRKWAGTPVQTTSNDQAPIQSPVQTPAPIQSIPQQKQWPVQGPAASVSAPQQSPIGDLLGCFQTAPQPRPQAQTSFQTFAPTVPMSLAVQQQPPQQQPGLLIDFSMGARTQPKPVDPNAKAQLLSCFGQSGTAGWQ